MVLISRHFFSHMAQESEEGSEESRAGLLVVDDCSIIRSLLHMVLTQSGFRVWLASSGPEALEQLKAHGNQIDLVVCDCAMRPWDGVETLRRLKEVVPQVRCCFLTGVGSDYTTEELLERGGLAVFNKPLSLPDFVRAVQRLTGAPLYSVPVSDAVAS